MSVCLCVRLFVRLSVCSLLRYHVNVVLPPLPEVWYPKFLEIRNPWGKVMERSGLRFEHFSLEGYIANFGISLDVFDFLRFEWFFSVFQKNLVFWLFLVHPTVVLVLLSTSVERWFVSRMRGFCLLFDYLLIIFEEWVFNVGLLRCFKSGNKMQFVFDWPL